jgi:hypothetical protein
MEELYTEGVASHGGPESCAGVREGVGEALTGVRAGWDIEPRKTLFWGADAVPASGRQHLRRAMRELLWDPARSENLGMYGSSLRENREIPSLPGDAEPGHGQGLVEPFAQGAGGAGVLAGQRAGERLEVTLGLVGVGQGPGGPQLATDPVVLGVGQVGEDPAR